MRYSLLIALSLICALALPGCGSIGRVASPQLVCPQLPPAPPNLMQEPSYGTQVRAELLEPQTDATPRCADCSE